jgi:hypothetical protein
MVTVVPPDWVLGLDAFPLPVAEPQAASARLAVAAAPIASQLRRATRLAKRLDLSGMFPPGRRWPQAPKCLGNISSVPQS